MDRQAPFGNEFLLPRGTLREPPGNLRRAGYILITKCDGSSNEVLVSRLRRYNRSAEIIELRGPLDVAAHHQSRADGGRLLASTLHVDQGKASPEGILVTIANRSIADTADDFIWPEFVDQGTDAQNARLHHMRQGQQGIGRHALGS